MDEATLKNKTLLTAEYRRFSESIHEKTSYSRPLNGMFELTYSCNLRCVHCYTDCYNRPNLIKRELSYEQITKILDELAESGVLWLCLTGGEIFMRKDFREIYLYAKRKGFLITLFTNATLISGEMADFLRACPPFSIETSLHAATQETFEKMTQVKGSFEKFLRGARQILGRGLPLKIKTKAMNVNVHELNQIKELVEGFGLEFRVNTQIYPRLDGDLEPTRYRLSPEETVWVENRYSDHHDEECLSSIEIEDDENEIPPENLYRCGCGTTSFYIDPYGTLKSCALVTKPIRRLQPGRFLDQFYALSHEIRSKVYETDSPCHTCRVYSLCDKIPASAAMETGDPENPIEHFCHVAYGREALEKKIKEGAVQIQEGYF